MRNGLAFHLAAGAILAMSGCDSATKPVDEVATLAVRVSTTGNDPDRDGYTIRVDDATSRNVAANGETTFDVAPGSHTVALLGLAANCRSDSGSPVTVNVTGGEPSVVRIDVACPGTSVLRVRVRTIGDMPDPDGYLYDVNGFSGALGPADTVTIAALPSGTYEVALGGIAPNCHQSADEDAVELAPAGNGLADITVFCLRPDAGWIAFTVRAPPVFEIWSMDATGGERTRVPVNERAFEPAISPDGRRIAYDNAGIVVMNVDGTGTHRLTDSGSLPDWSPDGQRIAYSARRLPNDAIADVYVIPSDGGAATNLTNNAAASDYDPAWSPDGSQIVFSSSRGGARGDLYIMNADGSNQRQLTNGLIQAGDADWSPDGQQILFSAALDQSQNSWSVYIIGVDGTGLQRLTSGTGDFSNYATWSPDGAWIAFGSTRGGPRTDIYVMRRNGSDIVRLTRMGELWGDTPSWGRR